MEKSFVFDSVRDASGKGDRVYKSEDFANYFNKFITNGYFPNVGDNLQVIAGGNMKVIVKPGAAWVNGRMYHNTADLTLQIDVADGLLSRIDRVVIRCDYLKREIKAYVKKGQFASSPVAPVLQRDGDAYELAVADVHIAKGATTVTQINIVDLRLNKELCGVVNSLLQADTTAIFNQFQDWFIVTKLKGESDLAAWTNEQKQLFIDWFNGLKDILSQNAETNILNKIHDIEVEVGELLQLKTVNKSSVISAINELADDYDEFSTDYDNYGVARKAEWKRSDSTLYRKSTLSNPDIRGNYLSQQVVYYAANGTAAVKTQQWAYTYDNRDNKTSEKKISEVFH